MDAVKQERLLSRRAGQTALKAQPLFTLVGLTFSRARVRRYVSTGAGWLLGLLAATIVLLLPVVLLALILRSLPLITTVPLENLTGLDWNPARGAFGLRPFVVGSLWVTALAMLISTPISLFSAVYLSEYIHSGHR